MAPWNTHLVILSLAVAVIGVLWCNNSLTTVVSWILVIVFGAMGFVFGASMALTSGKKYIPKRSPYHPRISNLLFTKMMELRENFSAQEKKTVTTKNLDLAIQEIMDFIIRDFVMSWYKDLGKDAERFNFLAQKEMWHFLEEFSVRLGNIDKVKFVTNEVVSAVQCHLHRIRIANTASTDGTKGTFTLHPWLSSEERELEFLRKVSSIFLIHLLRKPYAKCNPVRHLSREILACKVFKPAVDLICDPDYLNQKIYGWLLYKEQLANEHKRTYAYAATYEDFMKMIQHCDDVEHLQHMRYNIISEVMQATTIQNLKRAQGLDTDKEQRAKGTTKGDLLRARNLKRYINQLTVAKSHCEKRIHLLGGPDYSADSEDARMQEQKHIPGKKVYSYSVIMETADAREHLFKYLLKDDKCDLIGFWNAVERMRNSSQRHLHNLGSDVYQMFIMPPSSNVRSQLDKGTAKGMEAFLMGNTGPDAFYDAQKQIYDYVEEHFYHSFIVSDIYHRYIAGLHDIQDATDGHKRDDFSSKNRMSLTPEDEPSFRIAAHSTYAQQKLQQLGEKIKNKTQALLAMKRSQRPDAKIVKVQLDIEQEIEQLKTEKRTLEFHIDRTEVWLENLTKWKAHISTVETSEEEGKRVVYFLIVIHLPGTPLHQSQVPQSYTQGWVVTRKLQDFHALHQQLAMINPTLKLYELPRQGYSRIGTVSQEFLDIAKVKLDKFLVLILQDDSLAQSEALFAFFSPSPEHLKQAPTLSKKKFTFTNFFTSLTPQNQDSDSDDELIFIDDEGTVEKSRDSIAKPLYLLVAELFELKGVFKWLRRTLIAFVRVTYGRSINKQLRDIVDWIVSEQMLIYYLQQFKNAYWPNGELAQSFEPRSEGAKITTRRLAKEKILKNMPDAVKNLFGEKNVRHGAIKFFESLQDTRLNKQLFYDLLELLLYEAFPELENFKENQAPISPTDEKPPVSPPSSHLHTQLPIFA